MITKNIVVGAGISGITAARVLAERGEQVLIIDKRSHIGGNCYDYRDGNGICVHKYGTHIFHTDQKAVWDFLSRFTRWHPYMHKVMGLVDGQLVPIPFNLNSVRRVFPESLAARLEEKLILRFGFNKKIPILELRKTDDDDLRFLAEYVYQKVFFFYTVKQWGRNPEDLDSSVTGRVPVYISRDDRYFQNRWQGIPLNGYTCMLERILDHKNITVELNTSWNDIKNKYRRCRIFYTGSADELMDWRFGDLPYRSITLEFRECDREFFQTAAVINYPENYDFTRIGEYKYFLDDKSPRTVISLEYPSAYRRGMNEPYYPVTAEENLALHQRYISAAREEYDDIYFLGRLGDYQYYDMDKAVARTLSLVEAL